jgi:hypothetical protein
MGLEGSDDDSKNKTRSVFEGVKLTSGEKNGKCAESREIELRV